MVVGSWLVGCQPLAAFPVLPHVKPICGRIASFYLFRKEIVRRMEWFANMPLQWVVVIVIALLALRYSLKSVQAKWAKPIAETAESLAIAFALVFLIIRPFVVQAYFIPSASMEPGLLIDDHLLANKFIYRVRTPRRGEIAVFKAPPVLARIQGNKDFIKRVIGTPGDTIEVRQGLVRINDRPYDHSQVEDLFGVQRMTEQGEETWIKFHKGYLTITEAGATRKITKKEIAEAIGHSDAVVKIRPGVVIRNGKPLDEPYIAEDPNYDYPKRKVPANSLFMMGDNRNNSLDSHVWGFLPKKFVQGKAMFNFWPPKRIRLIR